jgi:hypothetical protein
MLLGSAFQEPPRRTRGQLVVSGAAEPSIGASIGDPVLQVVFGRRYRIGPAFAAKLRGGSPSQCRRHIS